MSQMPPPSSPGASYTPPPPPPTGGAAPGGDRQLMLVLAYLGILGIIPLVARPNDRDIKWHAINGLGLFVSYFVVAMLLWAADMMVGIPCAGTLVSCLLFFVYIGVAIFGIMKAVKGERLRLPVISEFADKQK